jgi:hypothetical protein
VFNLLVSGYDKAWEAPSMSMTAARFKEYSGKGADAVSVDQADSLKALEDVPALLMYEVGTDGPNARVVRHGRLKNIIRRFVSLVWIRARSEARLSNPRCPPGVGGLARNTFIREASDALGSQGW